MKTIVDYNQNDEIESPSVLHLHHPSDQELSLEREILKLISDFAAPVSIARMDTLISLP